MWMEIWGKERCIKESSEGARRHGRPRYVWKDIIKINRKQILREGVTGINLAEDKDQWQVIVYTVIKGQVS